MADFGPGDAIAVLDKAEIRRRALAFSKSWKGVTSERAESQTFWNDFFTVFGVERRQLAVYELIAKRSSTARKGRVDLLLPGQMAVEHKSAGQSLEKAMDEQLLDYLPSLPLAEHPWLLVVSDFEHFRWRNLDTGEFGSFALEEFPDHLHLFWWLAGYQVDHRSYVDEVAANLKATELLAELHDALLATGYPATALREWITRILFCLFADDAGVFERGAFHSYLVLHTAADGHDLGDTIALIFRVLDTPADQRIASLDEDLDQFIYINGDLFTNVLWPVRGDAKVRDALLEACVFDWSAISPAIFGSLFQNVMTKKERRHLGAHYTTEQNILRTIRPLFLDELEAELAVATTQPKLLAFHDKIAGLAFFDPACGCGNFLVIAYREIRRLESEVLRRLAEKQKRTGQRVMDLGFLCKVRVDQFYGIEIEEFPARIARTALYLIDHLENWRVSAEFGEHFIRFPIPAAPHIAIGNALRMDWNAVLPSEQADFVFGNPPFVGMAMMSTDQQEDNRVVFAELGRAGKRTGRLDYIACWYAKALSYGSDRPVQFAFVSTNSVTQGDQARALGPLLDSYGFHLDFAHRTFAWSSEAQGKAQVHVVVIGFSDGSLSVGGEGRRLFDYPDVSGSPVETRGRNISWYLADAPSVYPAKRTVPLLTGLPVDTKGCQPTDGGHLLVTRKTTQVWRPTRSLQSTYVSSGRAMISSTAALAGACGLSTLVLRTLGPARCCETGYRKSLSNGRQVEPSRSGRRLRRRLFSLRSVNRWWTTWRYPRRVVNVDGSCRRPICLLTWSPATPC